MKTVKKLSKTTKKWCELMGYDVQKIKENMKSSQFAVLICETEEEKIFNGVDRNFPFVLFNPFNFSVK
jgi:broad-specificity NMP kinase